MTTELDHLRKFRAEDAVRDDRSREAARAALISRIDAASRGARTSRTFRSPLAASRTAGPRFNRRLPWPRSGFGGALAMIVSIGIVALVAVAIATLGHNRSSPTGASPVPAGTPAAARGLVAQLAVLRRPQTAPDRTLHDPFREELAPAGWRVLRKFTRLVGAFPVRRGGSMRVYFVVSVPATRQAARTGPWRGAVVSEITVYRNTPIAGPPLHFDAHELDQPSARFGCGGEQCGIVPDRVKSASWLFGRYLGSNPSQAITVHPTIRNNLAFAPAPGARDLLLSETWYDADGRAIGSSSQTGVWQRAIARSERRPISPSLLAHFGLFRHPETDHSAPGLSTTAAASLADQEFYGLNVGQTRFVPLTGTEPPAPGLPHGVWVIPGSNGLCLQDTGGGGVCGDLGGSGSPESGHFVTTTTAKHRQWITGIVPDGSRTVAVVLTNGSHRTAPVVDNVYSIAITGHAVELITKNAAGQTTTMPL
jgi:hypothetical protein